MKLGPKFNALILERKQPALTDEPELQAGQIIVIKPHLVWITIQHRRKGNGAWAYLIRDDRPWQMGRSGGYTHTPALAIGASDKLRPGNLWDEPEAVEPHHHNVMEMQSKLRAAEQRREKAEQHAREDARRIAATVRDTLLTMARSGVDPTEYLARIHRATLGEQQGDRAA